MVLPFLIIVIIVKLRIFYASTSSCPHRAYVVILFVAVALFVVVLMSVLHSTCIPSSVSAAVPSSLRPVRLKSRLKSRTLSHVAHVRVKFVAFFVYFSCVVRLPLCSRFAFVRPVLFAHILLRSRLFIFSLSQKCYICKWQAAVRTQPYCVAAIRVAVDAVLRAASVLRWFALSCASLCWM
jgi:hypothetical protein